MAECGEEGAEGEEGKARSRHEFGVRARQEKRNTSRAKAGVVFLSGAEDRTRKPAKGGGTAIVGRAEKGGREGKKEGPIASLIRRPSEAREKEHEQGP